VDFLLARKRRNQDCRCGNHRRRSKNCRGEWRRRSARGRGRDSDTEEGVTDVSQEKTKLIDEIIDVIAAEGMIDRAKVTPDATIESLDLKSVDIVMILTALEEKFNVYIPMDGDLQEARDVKTLIDALAEHITKEREKL
jgi:acyl carrier protein